MKHFILIVCFPLSAFCQNTIGIPDIFNYPKEAYNAGLQNWDIKQDKNGIIYIANNEGLLSFDGQYWNLYPLPNKTIVRSVEIGSDHKIYVGGQDELGYFYPGPNGKLQYHSLTRYIPEKDKSFGDVWDILSFNKNIFFRSENKIFRFINESVAAFNAPEKWTFLGTCKGHLYAHDNTAGLMRFDHDTWTPLFSRSDLPVNDPVTGIIPLPGDSSLITTLKHGLFILADSGISKLPTENNALFETERIYAATAVNTDWIALATNNSGVYITDHQGHIIQRFSRTEGMQNNNVLSVLLDNQGNLWSGLDNGIDLIAYNSAIKQIKPMVLDGFGYTAIGFKNHLYAGTPKGLYRVALQSMKDLSFSKGNFEPVANTNGQIWGLADINNQLLLGKHEGAFVIKNNEAVPISQEAGYWNFVPLSGTYPASRIIAGYYNGLRFIEYNKGISRCVMTYGTYKWDICNLLNIFF